MIHSFAKISRDIFYQGAGWAVWLWLRVFFYAQNEWKKKYANKSKIQWFSILRFQLAVEKDAAMCSKIQ